MLFYIGLGIGGMIIFLILQALAESLNGWGTLIVVLIIYVIICYVLHRFLSYTSFFQLLGIGALILFGSILGVFSFLCSEEILDDVGEVLFFIIRIFFGCIVCFCASVIIVNHNVHDISYLLAHPIYAFIYAREKESFVKIFFICFGCLFGTLLIISVTKKIVSAINKNAPINLYNTMQKQLYKKLNKQCTKLGCMDIDKWRKVLSFYAERDEKFNINEFDKIVESFTTQQEYRNIEKNDNWFIPFEKYLLTHQNGATIAKMMNEVKCKALRMTHKTNDENLIRERLEADCKRKGIDVPALFEKIELKDTGECLYKPTAYLLHKYKKDTISNKSTLSKVYTWEELRSEV